MIYFCSFQLDDNQQLTSIGAYDILTAVNTDKSKVELLSFRVNYLNAIKYFYFKIKIHWNV